VIYMHAMITRHLIIVTTVAFNKEKVQITPRTIDPETHNPWTMKRSNLPHWIIQNCIFYPLGGFRRRFCYSNKGFAIVMAVLSFLLIFAEYLKNHSKSQKNLKIENLILLDSTWVDLHNEHIIWYTLVQSFCCNFRLKFLL
jgi:hypothetical protein